MVELNCWVAAARSSDGVKLGGLIEMPGCGNCQVLKAVLEHCVCVDCLHWTRQNG